MSIAYADDKLVRGTELLELYREAGWSQLAAREPLDIEESIRRATVFLTAREGARLVGFGGALSDGIHHAYVTELLVRRTHSGRGIEAELLRQLLEALPRERAITIFADPDSVDFYRRFGFAPMNGAMLLSRT